jgi:hypothetical protein
MKKSTTLFTRAIFTAIIASLLWACGDIPLQQPNLTETSSPTSSFTAIPNTPVPSNTPTQTVAATLISTPVPTLVAHEWIPSEPLIAFGNYGGDGSCGDIMPLPDFTLLSDGELFIMGWSDNLQAYGLQTTKLSRQDTCKLLNSVDQAVFFDYDPSTYIGDRQNWYPPVLGAGTTHISVQAWRSNSVSLYDLNDFINNVDEIKKAWDCGDCPDLEFPIILPSIRRTYQLLTGYQPLNLENYQSAILGVWVHSYVDASDAVPWPLETISLSEFVSPQLLFLAGRV